MGQLAWGRVGGADPRGVYRPEKPPWGVVIRTCAGQKSACWRTQKWARNSPTEKDGFWGTTTHRWGWAPMKKTRGGH